jgi:hypothetical protein
LRRQVDDFQLDFEEFRDIARRNRYVFYPAYRMQVPPSPRTLTAYRMQVPPSPRTLTAYRMQVPPSDTPPHANGLPPAGGHAEGGCHAQAHPPVRMRGV